MKKYFIYTLTNPKTGMVFYVGLTHNPMQRLGAHCTITDFNPSAVCVYITEHDIMPQMDVVDEVVSETKPEAMKVERYWIEQFRALGFTLINYRCKPSKRIKSSPARRGRSKWPLNDLTLSSKELLLRQIRAKKTA